MAIESNKPYDWADTSEEVTGIFSLAPLKALMAQHGELLTEMRSSKPELTMGQALIEASRACFNEAAATGDAKALTSGLESYRALKDVQRDLPPEYMRMDQHLLAEEAFMAALVCRETELAIHLAVSEFQPPYIAAQRLVLAIGTPEAIMAARDLSVRLAAEQVTDIELLIAHVESEAFDTAEAVSA